ncbi:unnamed protein product [Rotaria sp. Silwood2]|nr:unnamed protein product [Rotaria sp. Silwood2]CAF4040314.1 unnamed protein product [Rotaria sp. Silwood2]
MEQISILGRLNQIRRRLQRERRQQQQQQQKYQTKIVFPVGGTCFSFLVQSNSPMTVQMVSPVPDNVVRPAAVGVQGSTATTAHPVVQQHQDHPDYSEFLIDSIK